jgi:hypothetical protein
MSLWPRDIADDEAIARGICSPYHVKKGKLQPNTYNPPYDTDEVSVMRVNWIGADACKQRAKELENPAENKVYKGLAVLSARQIWDNGAAVVDTREVFEGHADIRHGITPSKGEPPPPEELKALRDRTKALANLAKYYPDPDPAAVGWVGPTLRYKD